MTSCSDRNTPSAQAAHLVCESQSNRRCNKMSKIHVIVATVVAALLRPLDPSFKYSESDADRAANRQVVLHKSIGEGEVKSRSRERTSERWTGVV